ncbi:hypothetical protein ACFLXX_01790 [Chloroflexota bacterium]
MKKPLNIQPIGPKSASVMGAIADIIAIKGTINNAIINPITADNIPDITPTDKTPNLFTVSISISPPFSDFTGEYSSINK